MQKKTKIFGAGISTLALFGMTIGLGVVASSAQGAEPLNIVQLGDSYSAGNGSAGVYESDCSRSTTNYGAQVAKELGASYKNVACSGAVAADLVERAQDISTLGMAKKSITKAYYLPRSEYPDQSAEWQKRIEAAQMCGEVPLENGEWEYRRVAPAPAGNIYTATLECRLHNKMQIEAVTPDTDIVFLTIGGNDADFFGIAVKCLVMRSGQLCDKQMNYSENILRNEAGQRVTAVLDAIEKNSQGNAEVYLLSYPDLINTGNYLVPENAFAWYDFGAKLQKMQQDYTQMQSNLIADMNQKTASQRYHLVDIRTAFAGHGMNPYRYGSQANTWINPPFQGGPIMGYIHPNQAGWDAEAAVLSEYLRTHR